MSEPILKRISCEGFTVDFIEKDGFTHIHLYGKPIDIDKHVFNYFRRPIKNTGEEIDNKMDEFKKSLQLGEYDDARYMSEQDQSLFLAQRKKLSDKYKELLKLYEDRGYIHKSTTKKLIEDKNLDTKRISIYELTSPVISYRVPEINPFIDKIMLSMTTDIEAAT